ncbi:hypothetical protein J2777_002222 [Paraburkholderia graminis]|nr:hypothetical protein [Paraburkholderia graminis]MDR6468494.1 hypothetical protein [Paraburkholderia graminis]
MLSEDTACRFAALSSALLFVFAFAFALPFFIAEAASFALPAFDVLTVFSALTGTEVFPALMALAAFAAVAAFAAFAGLAPVVARLALAGCVACASAADEAEAVDASSSAVEALGDAVLRRAERADPEDVTMGFLREARVC